MGREVAPVAAVADETAGAPLRKRLVQAGRHLFANLPIVLADAYHFGKAEWLKPARGPENPDEGFPQRPPAKWRSGSTSACKSSAGARRANSCVEAGSARLMPASLSCAGLVSISLFGRWPPLASEGRDGSRP